MNCNNCNARVSSFGLFCHICGYPFRTIHETKNGFVHLLTIVSLIALTLSLTVFVWSLFHALNIVTLFITVTMYLAFLNWGIFSTFGWLGLAAQRYKAERGKIKSANVEFVIVSIAARHVQHALFNCITHTVTMFPDKQIWLVVDEGAELIDAIQAEFGNTVSIITTPHLYRPELVGKGRAMNYFIETTVSPSRWYTFIDDDNLILDDNFLYELPVYEKQGYVACNPIIIPRKGRSTYTYAMDSLRYFDDVTVFKFFTGLTKRPMCGMHGEMLTVRGDILKALDSYGTRSITEDFRLGLNLYKHKMRVWHSSTKVSILSPNSIHDLLKQRGRWFKGITTDLKDCSLGMKTFVTIRQVNWMVALFGSWALFPFWFLYWGGSPYFYIGGAYVWTIYIYGSIKARSPWLIPTIPVMGILEAVSIYFGLRNKQFVVINKN